VYGGEPPLNLVGLGFSWHLAWFFVCLFWFGFFQYLSHSHQLFFVMTFSRQVLENYLPGLALNCDSPDPAS
jgi:hypothetical protein